MRININFLSQFINLEHENIIPRNVTREKKREILKELFASIGMETSEIIDFNGKDVFEIEITPNRPDWLSHFGVARDMHSRLPELIFSPLSVADRQFNFKNEDFIINIEDQQDCGRYTGCIVRDIEVKESSPEVKDLLESFGLRPINNIVDISNMIVMTMGQPIHMFDLEKLQGNEINIRRAKQGEKILLLDEQEVDLSHDFLVIADKSEPVALAGIMGGLLSGVTSKTKNILIESAYFNPVVIRKVAKKLGIKSDASYRFERGADIMIPPTALRMALDMIEKSLNKKLSITYFDDRFPAGFTSKSVELDKNYPSEYSGIDIGKNISEQILRDLGFKLQNRGDKWTVDVPSYRVDIYGKQDLVEEICRIYGYDRLISQIPNTLNSSFKIDSRRELIQKIRNHLTSIGFFEVINYIFLSEEENGFFSKKDNSVEIQNPLGKEFQMLRKSLIPGLIKNSVYNFNQSINGINLFEFGYQYRIEGNEIQEKEILALSASGEYQKPNWKEKEGQDLDFFMFKSLVATLFRRLSVDFKLKKSVSDFLEKECSFLVLANGFEIGYMGRLKKEISDWYKINNPVLVAEMRLSKIAACVKDRPFKMWNKFPSSSRDFSFLIDKKITYDKLIDLIEECKPDSLENYELFDYYRGKGIPKNKISLSMSFSYRDKSRTLTNEEINLMHEKLVEKLKTRLNLVQR